jgi:hypothetical protein
LGERLAAKNGIVQRFDSEAEGNEFLNQTSEAKLARAIDIGEDDDGEEEVDMEEEEEEEDGEGREEGAGAKRPPPPRMRECCDPTTRAFPTRQHEHSQHDHSTPSGYAPRRIPPIPHPLPPLAPPSLPTVTVSGRNPIRQPGL